MADRKLSHPLKLRDGRVLKTLADVIDVFDQYFATVIRDDALVHAFKLMEKAAMTGKRADIQAATDQIEIVLRHRSLMD